MDIQNKIFIWKCRDDIVILSHNKKHGTRLVHMNKYNTGNIVGSLFSLLAAGNLVTVPY